MEFAFKYIVYFIDDLTVAWPLLAFLGLIILLLGLIVGAIESWPRFD